ncbi:MAG: hypothetical protein JTT11_00860 [Candidatus Brockarchaeota archaeon]|nr:hypothetical protein [Candidatus Brockarchaeota archaeon]
MIVSASGIRGVFKPAEEKAFFSNLGRLVGSRLPGAVALGRDSRPSGQAICSALLEGMVESRASITYAGLCTVPVLAHAVRKRYVSTSVMVTASHNPPEWNGIKIFTGEGLIMEGPRLRELAEEARAAPSRAAGEARNSVARVKEDKGLLEAYVRDSISLAFGLGARECALRFVIDAGNGPSALAVPRVLEGLGCRTEVLNGEMDGSFKRPIEPLPENLSELREEVLRSGSDVGAGFDCDGDRVVLVTDDGEVLREDYTLALAVDYYLSLRKCPVVVNRATSMLLDRICQDHSVPIIRAGVGERNVASAMLEVGSEIGGEGSSGGVVMPEFELARDGALALALLSGLLKRERESLSRIVKRYPRFHLRKESVRCPAEKAKRILSKVEAEAKRVGAVDVLDDVRVSGSGWWVLVRPSATEPLVRVLSEARSEEEAESRMEFFAGLVKKNL